MVVRKGQLRAFARPSVVAVEAVLAVIMEEVTSASDRMEVRKQEAIVPHRYILHRRFPLRIFAVGSFHVAVAVAVAVAALLAADTCAIRLVGRVSFLAFPH